MAIKWLQADEYQRNTNPTLPNFNLLSFNEQYREGQFWGAL